MKEKLKFALAYLYINFVGFFMGTLLVCYISSHFTGRDVVLERVFSYALIMPVVMLVCNWKKVLGKSSV